MGAVTCRRSNGSSVVDYICVRGDPLSFTSVPSLLGGLSDHVPLLCTVRGPTTPSPPTSLPSRTVYRWVGHGGRHSQGPTWREWEQLGDDVGFVSRLQAALPAETTDLS